MLSIPFIETRSLTRAFGRNYALHRVDLRLVKGEVSMILGPNGAGKSTLLSILATLDRPTLGEVRYGEKLSHRAMTQVGRGRIGWASHNSLLYEELSGVENLLFYAHLYRVSDAEGRVAEAVERIALSEGAERPVRTYSRGMRQRLSIARAILNQPDILLLDEPLSGLDRDGRTRVIELLIELKDRGCLIALSSHILDLPPGFVDKAFVLRRGQLRYGGSVDGSVAQLYEKVLGNFGCSGPS